MSDPKIFTFIDEPSPFDTLEDLECALNEYEALGERVLLRENLIEYTKWLIAWRRNEPSAPRASEMAECAIKEFQESMKNTIATARGGASAFRG